MHKGSCLCGAVRFEVSGDLPGPAACHCRQCRKSSGHYFASCDVPEAALPVEGEDRLGWFGVAMGAFDGATDTHLAKHIFVADKGDYYEIRDGLPQDLYPPPPPAR